MNSQAAIINASGDFEESILRMAKHLGRDKNRRAVFDLIYGRGSKPRSKKQIADLLGKGQSAQVIQNVLDELAKHHLIVRYENAGTVKDGSRWIYGKDAFVRANRNAIVKYADDPGAAKRIATKRRPTVETKISFVKAAPAKRAVAKVPRSRRSQARLKIAVLMTNPDSQAPLQTAIEARDIEQSVKLESKTGDADVKLLPAPTLDTVLDMLNSYRPDVIHFSGHGGGQTLLFDNEKAGQDGGSVLNFDMIARVVSATAATPKLLVLVACDTVDGADRFLDAVPAVIAMADSIGDEAACEFSRRFYRSIGGGATIANSLDQAKLVLENKGYLDADLPKLLSRDDKAGKRALL
jgi:hypothetical protein